MDTTLMDNFIFDLILLGLATLLGLAQGLILFVLKGIRDDAKAQWKEIAEQKDAQIEQWKTLVRIDTKLDHYEELKKAQEHDHKELRLLDKHVSTIELRVDTLERQIEVMESKVRSLPTNGSL